MTWNCLNCGHDSVPGQIRCEACRQCACPKCEEAGCNTHHRLPIMLGIIAIPILFVLALLYGCSPTGSAFKGGSTQSTPVFAPDPKPQPKRTLRVSIPVTQPTQYGNPAYPTLPPGFTYDATEYYQPLPPVFATAVSSTQPSLSGDAAKGKVGGLSAGGDVAGSSFDLTALAPDKSWIVKIAWALFCLAIAFGTYYFGKPKIAAAALAVAALVFVPAAYFGYAFVATFIIGGPVLLYLAWDGSRHKLATEEVVAGVDKFKAELSDPKPLLKTLATEQSASTERLVRKARGKP